jgi:competence protein ComEC
MEHKSNNKLKILVGVILIIAIIICAIYAEKVNKINENTENIYNNINIDKSKLNIFYFNVGQADSTLITYEDKSILIDAGNDSDGERIVDFLQTKGITKIDYLIGTHIHEDHIGGLADIINNLEVENLFMPYNLKEESNFYQKVKNSIEENNLSIQRVNKGDTYNLSTNLLFRILYVDNMEPLEPNNASIVIQLEYGTQKYLFMGDAEKEVENKLIEEGKLEDIDVLKVGHHGSNTSSIEDFINKVLPEISIISVQYGKYNNVPSEDVINRLKLNNNKVYRTDTDGTIWLTSDGKSNAITILNELNLNGANKLGMRVYLKYALFS